MKRISSAFNQIHSVLGIEKVGLRGAGSFVVENDFLAVQPKSVWVGGSLCE